MQFDLSGLEAFIAVVDCGGVGRAAQQLHKAQSAVSHQVRKLEEQLGIALFNRDGYRVQLTPAGEAVLAEGRRVLSQAEHVGSVAQQFTQGWEPRLLVIIDGILPLDPILDGLKTLAAEDGIERQNPVNDDQQPRLPTLGKLLCHRAHVLGL